jgi:hypothetical protein
VKKLITFATLLVILVVACGEEGITIDEAELTPDDVLTNLSASFYYRDAKTVAVLVGPDFVFHFDPYDVGRNPPGGSNYFIPESWNRSEFLAAVGNMLASAYSINLDIPTSGIGEPAAGAGTYRAEGVPVSLLVMIDELNGYIANGGYCNFEFEKYYAANDEPRWRLTGWWDKTRADADAASIPASLGCVLAMYYPT